jgi:hypothetical protein
VLAGALTSLLIVGSALFAWRIYAPPKTDSMSLTASGEFPATASVSLPTPDRSNCHQYQLDNSTGGLMDRGIAECRGGKTGLGAISDSFRSK